MHRLFALTLALSLVLAGAADARTRHSGHGGGHGRGHGRGTAMGMMGVPGGDSGLALGGGKGGRGGAAAGGAGGLGFVAPSSDPFAGGMGGAAPHRGARRGPAPTAYGLPAPRGRRRTPYG